jgi:hypothetical protein
MARGSYRLAGPSTCHGHAYTLATDKAITCSGAWWTRAQTASVLVPGVGWREANRAVCWAAQTNDTAARLLGLLHDHGLFTWVNCHTNPIKECSMLGGARSKSDQRADGSRQAVGGWLSSAGLELLPALRRAAISTSVLAIRRESPLRLAAASCRRM